MTDPDFVIAIVALSDAWHTFGGSHSDELLEELDEVIKSFVPDRGPIPPRVTNVSELCKCGTPLVGSQTSCGRHP